MKFIDLFCGIGGFHQALKNHECVFACDIDKNCREIYKQNYDIEPEGDICLINEKDIPEFDILTGGFPCQNFSNAGKKLHFKTQRGNLFEEIIRIAKYHKPKFMFLENVKHIQKIANGEVFKHIIKKINEIDYKVQTINLSPIQFGIPQNRERVIFICIRNDIYKQDFLFKLPEIIETKNIFETDKKITDKYKINNELEEVLNIWNEIINIFDINEKCSPTIMCHEFYKNYNNEEFNLLPLWKQDYIIKNKPLYIKYKIQWDQWYNKYGELLKKKEIYGKLEWQVGVKKENDSIWKYFIQIRQSGIRVKKIDYFPTLVAIVQTPIYGKEKRYITPRECARLQSFPDNFIIHKNDHIAYKQFGNAVNVDVVKFIIDKIIIFYQ